MSKNLLLKFKNDEITQGLYKNAHYITDSVTILLTTIAENDPHEIFTDVIFKKCEETKKKYDLRRSRYQIT